MRQGATKLGPVGPALLIVLLRRQSSSLLYRLLPILAMTGSICVEHDSLQSSVTPSSLVISTFSISHYLLQDLVEA